MIVGWIDLWNYRSSWTLWEDQNVEDSLLKDVFFLCFLQYIFSVTLDWLGNLLKLQFSSSRSDLHNLKKIKYALLQYQLYWYVWFLIHSNSGLDGGEYLKKISADWKFWGKTLCSFIFKMVFLSLICQSVINMCTKLSLSCTLQLNLVQNKVIVSLINTSSVSCSLA